VVTVKLKETPKGTVSAAALVMVGADLFEVTINVKG